MLTGNDQSVLFFAQSLTTRQALLGHAWETSHLSLGSTSLDYAFKMALLPFANQSTRVSFQPSSAWPRRGIVT